MSEKSLLPKLLPPLLKIALRIHLAKNHFSSGKKEDKKLAGFLEYLTKVEFFTFQIDFSYFYYILTNQIKLDSVKNELYMIMQKLMYFKSTDPEDFDIYNEALKYTKQGNTDKSISMIKELIERNPNYKIYWMDLDRTYYELGLYDMSREVREEFEKHCQKITDKENVTKRANECLKTFIDKKLIMYEFFKKREVYKTLLNKEMSLITCLKTLLGVICNFLKTGKSDLPKRVFIEIMDDWYEFLEWISLISELTFYQLIGIHLEDDIIEDIKEAIVKFLGWIPETLPEIQKPNFLSPNLRKEAWEKILGFDIVRFKAFNSINEAKYIHIDGNIDNDNPENHIWMPKDISIK